MHQNKKQNTPRRRARETEEDGSLPFLHRPPESGLILDRSCVICVIYDGGRLPESGHVTKSRLLIGQPQEMVPRPASGDGMYVCILLT